MFVALRRGLAPVLATAAGLATAAPLFAGDVIDLGALQANHAFVQANAISEDGSVVVGMSGVNFFQQTHSFRWSNGAMEDIGTFPGGVNIIANSVSADGGWITGSSYGADRIAFRWSSSTGLQNLGNLGGIGAEAAGISLNGAVVSGAADTADGDRAFRWTPSTGMQSLGVLPGGAYSFGTGISADGRVITGYADNGSGEVAFSWTEQGGMQPLPGLNGEGGAGIVVNHDGSVIVGYSGLYAARWVNGAVQSLDTVTGGTFSVAYAVSGDGLFAGGLSDNADGDIVATLWSEQLGSVDLNTYLTSLGFNLDGWQLAVTTGISYDGRTLVGAGTFNGIDRGWMVTIPSPAGASIFTIAGLVAVRRRRA